MDHIIKQIKKEIPSSVKIIAVTKAMNQTQIIELINLGHEHFGENKIRDAEAKWNELKGLNKKIKLHFIGHLQSNKIKQALNLFDVIDSIDSFILAEKIAAELKKSNSVEKDFKVQVNIGEEKQKYGIAPSQAPKLVKYCKEDLDLNITGLMAIPPIGQPPAPYFKKLKQICDELNLKEVSMGMSDDYKEAINCGATEIRLGSILQRENYSQKINLF